MADHVTAVIVNYNAGNCLVRCIESLLDSDISVAVIVVDNASDDQSVNKVMHLAASGLPIKTLINPENIGYSRACNQGFKVVDSTFTCFVNPDCEVQSDAMRLLRDALVQDSGAAMSGGWVTNPDGSAQRATWRNLPDARRSFMEFSRLGK